ncbi:MAG: T9SS type A sorting domain-containing protein [candidate division Zixibacteria bacterium]|nr:T9SS type A sorting domain-containing protein [candidate division Zixibacteria bacterium]
MKKQRAVTSTIYRFSVVLILTAVFIPAPAFGYGRGFLIIYQVGHSLGHLNQLVALRESQGFTVYTENTTNIYNEYANISKQEAIRSYIKQKYDDTGSLFFVLLCSTSMLEEYTHYEIPLPFHMGRAQSDDWYGCVAGDDDIPDLVVGRVECDPIWPIKYVFDKYVEKLLAYEEHAGEPWLENVLFALEDCHLASGPLPWEEYKQQMYDYANELKAKIGGNYNHTEIRESDYLNATYIPYRNALAQGVLASIYWGVPSENRLGGPPIEPPGESYGFISHTYDPTPPDDIIYLNNPDKYPFFINLSCATDGIGSALVATNAYKGGIASIAPRTAVEATVQYDFGRLLIDEIFSSNHYVLGEAVYNAKYQFLKKYHRKYPFKYYQLYGDPTISLKVPHAKVPSLISGWPVTLGCSTSACCIADTNPPLCESLPFENPPYYIPEYSPADVTVTYPNFTEVFEHDGDYYGRRALLKSPTASTTADINGGGKLDIITIAGDKLFVTAGGGEDIPPFPISCSTTEHRASVGDINGDGYLDIVFASTDKVYVVDRNGSEIFHAHLPIGYVPIGSPAIGDLDNDGSLEIVVGTQSMSDDSYICVYDKDGNMKPGWPYPLGSETIRPPVLADLTDDGTVEVVVASNSAASPSRAYYRVIAYSGTSITFKYFDNFYFEFTPAVGNFVPWGNEWTGKETVVVGLNTSDYEYKILALDADDGTTIRTISMGNKVPTSAPTVGDVNNKETNEVVIGCEDCMMAYDLNCGLVPFQGHWNCALKGDVTTPAVTGLNGDCFYDIVCSDSEAVYAFTTNTPYLALENFDWVRDGHDNLNMGLWDIAAPTGLVAADVNNDQGGEIILAWTASVDAGVRSSRVNEYKIYRTMGEVVPPGGDNLPGDRALRAKLAEANRAAALAGNTFISPAALSDKTQGAPRLTGGGADEEFFEYLTSVYPPDYSYIDEGLENGKLYKYYLVATDGTHDSQRSIIVEAVPHDNIPPAPPTNFDLEVVWEDPSVRLMWTRSIDDPMYEPGEPGDSAREKAPVLAFGAPWGTASAPAPYATGVFRPGIDAASAASSDAGAGGAFAAYAPRGRGGALPLSEKEGDALKAKVAEGRLSARNYYLTTRPGLLTGKDSGFDAGANDVEKYRITKSVQGQPMQAIYYYPVTPGNDVEYLDTDVSYGNIYYYTICAMDSENLSEEVGPLTANLNEAPPDGGPLALMPPGVFPGGAYAPDGDDTFAATGAVDSGWGVSRTKAAKVVTCKPNPVTGTATFTITLPTSTRVRLDVYDLSGRRVDTVLDKRLEAGSESVVWQPRVANGVYIYKLETPSEQYAGKVVVAR